MANIDYTSSGGGYRLSTPGSDAYSVPGGGASGGPPDISWLMNLAKQSAQNKIAKQRQDLDLTADDARYQRQQRRAIPRLDQRARMDASRDRSAAEMARRNAPTEALAPFNAANQFANRMENPLDRYTSGNSNLGSDFRNATFAADLSKTQLSENPWMQTYGAAAGAGGEAIGQAGQNQRQRSDQNFMQNNAGLLRFLRQ